MTDLVVPAELDGARADKTVAELCAVSRSVARAAIEAGEVTRDGARLRPSDRVSAGDELDAVITSPGGSVEAHHVDFGIAYEDDAVVVVDKPAGLVVHPGAGTADATLANGLLARYPWATELGEAHRWGIVHRLDKDTSGLLLVAKTLEAFEKLQDDLRARTVSRRYRALVAGGFDGTTGTIEAPIGRDPTNPTRMAVVATGRAARTHYRVLRTWGDPEVTLLSVELDTGRTHQIRVHLKAIDRPIVGDPVYGPRRTITGDPGRPWLHAAELAFPHPVTGANIEVSSPLPADLTAALAALGEPAGGMAAGSE